MALVKRRSLSRKVNDLVDFRSRGSDVSRGRVYERDYYRVRRRDPRVSDRDTGLLRWLDRDHCVTNADTVDRDGMSKGRDRGDCCGCSNTDQTNDG
jgi:hypothetical protein